MHELIRALRAFRLTGFWIRPVLFGFVVTIASEADRLNRLVGDLLDGMRLEAGALSMDLEIVAVPADKVASIFGDFVQANNAASSTGFGLGSGSPRRLTEQTAGTLAYRDRVGGEATFTVSLPIWRDQSDRSRPRRLNRPGLLNPS